MILLKNICVILWCDIAAQMTAIDNTCPADATQAGASSAEAAKEKLEWKDVFELTEWFRPGTIKKDSTFDPTKM